MDSRQVTQADADALRWFHSIELGNGVVTKGAKSLSVLKKQTDTAFRYGVEGKTVLDIGAWDGAFSFSAEERGAVDVLAADHYSWVGPGWGKKAAFDLARAARGSRVRDTIIDVPDLSADTVGVFDIVLFLGVLYHLKHPFWILEQLAPMTREVLVIDTETTFDTTDVPLMRFFPGAELNKDASNWWAPNVACMTAMLKVAGFRRIEMTPNPNHVVPINATRGRFFFYAFK